MDIRISALVPITALLSFLLSACELINPQEDIPVYIQIDTVTLSTLPREGSSGSKITNIAVSAAGQDLGIYHLPTQFPVYAKGATQLVILPAIQVNGRSQFIRHYPFYTAYVQTLELEAPGPVSIDFQTSYQDNTVFALIEDFETGINYFVEDFDDDKDTHITRTQDDVSGGSQSGALLLSREHPIIEVASIPLGNVLQAQRDAYIEMDYKNDVVVNVLAALRFNTGELRLQELTSLRPRDQWNKVYVLLTPTIRTEGLNHIKIVIRAEAQEEDPTPAQVLLDNIKVVYQ